MLNDDELKKIFVEEARDLLENVNSQLEKWRHAFENITLLSPILRELHTLKGSARMVGLIELHEYIHLLEKFIQKIHHQEIIANSSSAAEVQFAIDFIHSYVDKCATFSQMLTHFEISPNYLQRLIDFQSEKKEERNENQWLSHTENPSQQTISEFTRIKTDVLDNFGQLTDQINISRSHLEQQIKGSNELMSEVIKHIKYMQELMRHIQLKTDANLRLHQSVLYEKNYEEFDVLEMDRYNTLQQSTRALGEKLDHVEFLNNQINHSLKNVEVYLVEQKRAVVNLNEGITHTRLISIEHLIPRLKRVVRQVSHDLEKEVHLECTKVEGEIDRKVLEKLIPPFEHMLRNAIDHGIESPQTRVDAGKKPYGMISLSTFRQGNDILVELADDGSGIDPQKIRAKAIEKKLWDEDAPMSKAEAVQMIFLPGFSTKDKVSPISGHGVGMDVVNTEVSKLGGSLRIDTQLKQGTKFTIRLPLVSSLNQALVFEASKKTYALQLSHLAGLTRLSHKEIILFKKNKSMAIYFANQQYQLFKLTTLLDEKANLEENVGPQPVILLHSEQYFIAILVDKLFGSKELVIKPPGPQLQFVREIAGISILADEQVAIVLDPQSLIMRAINCASHPNDMKELASRPPALTNTKVLIVDDSVTVRKITSRFLKRFGYEPLTAKDGEEAFKVMQQTLPDVVLLDIEMPIMDGFEVVKRMREQEPYKKIPIIMITSRSGDKHRSTALSLGANAYLSKPFVEADLLALIRKFKTSLH